MLSLLILEQVRSMNMAVVLSAVVLEEVETLAKALVSEACT